MGQTKRIAINTGGGDAPGLNAVIRAVTLAGVRRGWEVLGIQKGYEGLLDTSKIIPLDRRVVHGITQLGGTILGTTNKGDPFGYPMTQDDGTIKMVDRSQEVIKNFRELELNALIAVGGDGSLKIAHKFALEGIPVIGVPKTIDNDLESTVVTFGFDTAVTVATEAIDRLRTTAEAHERVIVVEVMGRYAGWISLWAGLSGAADAILIPEIPFDLEKVCQAIDQRWSQMVRPFSIVVVAEGAKPVGGEMSVQGAGETGRQEVLLGGIGDQVAKKIHDISKKDTRSVVLGHIQRGGSPTTFDRNIALRFGAAAVRAIEQGINGVMVALDPPKVRTVGLHDAVRRMKTVDLESDAMATARDLGISFGD